MKIRYVNQTQFKHRTGAALTLVIALLSAASNSVGLAQAPTPAPPLPGPTADADADDLDSLLDLVDKDFTQLERVKATSPSLDVEVSTVSRQKSTIGRSPAAVFVITNEMIKRSGARSIPEALRMAPGVHVAKIDANKWAISIRGSTGRFANKLLVQIDGRSSYTPLFAGVFWDVQDTLLEDVERIEIIRGPGATVWGVNAVNGVINIITKKAKDTQGTYLMAGAGTEERGFASGRYGGQLGHNAHYRVYGKGFDRDTAQADNNNAHDDWRMARGGFRMDWTPDCEDSLTIQGDIYEGYTGRRNVYADPNPPTFSSVVDDDAHVAGGNALVRWTHTYDDDTEWSLQGYFDRTERSYNQIDFREDRETVDLDFQYRFKLGDRHSVICGAGYRNTRDRIRNTFAISFFPDRRSDDLFSYFVQDEITLSEDYLYLTLGSKFSHSDYTPFEYQPTARLVWLPTDRHSVWTSVSRAVRSPSRADHNVRILAAPSTVPGVFPTVFGNDQIVSEDLVAYEIGVRSQVTDKFSWDWAAFFNRYNNLSTSTIGAPTAVNIPPVVPIIPITLEHGNDADTYGFEVSMAYDVHESWRLHGNYSFIRLDTNGSGSVSDTDSARNLINIHSTWDIGCNWHFDAAWRYVDSLPNIDVPSYNTMDLRLSWTPTRNLEFAVAGRNLLEGDHFEFTNDRITGNVATAVEREVYGVMSVRY